MDDYLKLAKSLALQAGEIMLKYFNKGMKRKYKSDLAVVTNADEEINRLVIKSIEDKYPEHSVFGEEESSKKLSNNVWVCDPVDGTWMYAKGVPVACFSLAYTENLVPLVGVVYDPFMKRLYTAVKGKGAKCNDEKIQVSNVPIRKSTIDCEWWPEATIDFEYELHKMSLNTKAYVLHLGSVVNACCLVASGKYEACVYPGTAEKNTVDIAAVKLIVEEAGGRVTDLFGKEFENLSGIDGAIVSNGIVYNTILKHTENLKRIDP